MRELPSRLRIAVARNASHTLELFSLMTAESFIWRARTRKFWCRSWRLREVLLLVIVLFFALWWLFGGTRPPLMDSLWRATCDAKCLENADRWTAPKVTNDASKRVQYIHQSWKTDVLPSRFEKWSQSWRKCFPTAIYLLWTDEDNLFFIAKYYPWFLERYLTFPSNIFRVDAVRYFYLFHYGGIYADLDTECIRPFNHLLQAPVVLGAMDGKANVREGYVQNSFMYSTRGHPLWMSIVRELHRSWNRRAPEYLTGPHALASGVKSFREGKQKTNDDIVIYPPQYFNPFSWMTNAVAACKDYNAMSDTDVLECRKAYLKESFVIQYHAHSWPKPVLV